jgi:hypothetical protein
MFMNRAKLDSSQWQRHMLLMLNLSAMLCVVVASTPFDMDAIDAYSANGDGTYSTRLTDPDTVEAQALADGIEVSYGEGWVKSEEKDIFTSSTSYVQGQCDYYLYEQVSKEYGDDIAKVEVIVQLYLNGQNWFPSNATYQSDFAGTVEQPTGWIQPGEQTGTYQLKTRAKAYAKGRHLGSYTDADFYDTLVFDVDTFYVIRSPY